MKKVYCQRIVIVSLSLFLVSASYSQDTLSLGNAIKIGLENNFSILLSKNELEIAKNNNTIGNAGMLPKIDASGGYSNSIQSVDRSLTDGTSDAYNNTTSALSAGLQLNWTLFDGLAMFINKDQLVNLQSMGDLKYKMAVEDAVASIIVTYYSIVQQQKLIRSLRESFTLSKERLNVTKEKSKIGYGFELQVIEAEVDLRADSSNLLRQVNYFQNLMVDLNRYLGREPGIEFEVEPLKIVVELPDYKNIIEGMSKSNAELMYERIVLDNRKLGVKLYEAGRYPRLGLSGSYNFSNYSYSYGSTESSKSIGPSFGLTASIPLFNGFNVSRNIKNAQVQLENQQISLLQKENLLKSLAFKYFNDYNLAISLIKTEETAMSLAGKNLSVAMEKYRLGAISDLELREIQKKLLDVQYRFYSSQLQAKSAEIELKILAGVLLNDINTSIP
ncbi:MAG: TolC family protein [Tenuifilaceae bacterium]